MKFATVRQKVLISAAPEEVYLAYTDPARHAEFTGSAAEGSPRVGGKFTAWDGYISGRYLELTRGKKIVHEWKTTEWPAGYPPSTVEITLEGKGSRTQLTMVQTKAPEEQADDYAQGWIDYYWEPMKRFFSKGKAQAKGK